MSKEYIESKEVVVFLENMAASRYLIQCFENKEKFPFADVKPVRHGRWIPNWGGPFILGNYCSLCNHYEEITIKHSEGSNYCPNCGADMRGGNK